jgi:uncharacterized membrane protein YadS
VFLGFGLDLGVIAKVGVESLSVMVFTIAAALITAYILGKLLRLDPKIGTLDGGSFDLKKIVPWFVLAFLAASLVGTAFGLRVEVASSLSEIGKFGICIARAPSRSFWA